MDIILDALDKGRHTLSEHESKELLAGYGIPVTRERIVHTRAELADALAQIGFPCVMKGCGPLLTHKTERALVHLDLRTEQEASRAYDLIAPAVEGPGAGVLVQEMVRGTRELVMGLTRDAQFGPCVMFGLGGIFTEVLADASFRVAPLGHADAVEMMGEIDGRAILGEVRGLPGADSDLLAHMLVTLGTIGMELDDIEEIDINPVILARPGPVAVDAFVALSAKAGTPGT